MGGDTKEDKVNLKVDSDTFFYEKYTDDQNEIAEYCYGRFIEEVIPRLPDSTHDGLFALIEMERDRLFGANRVLGGYLPVWLAESLGIDDPETIQDLSFASFVGRFWFILYDYKLDDGEKLVDLGVYEAIEPMLSLIPEFYLQVIPEEYHQYFREEFDRLLAISYDANNWEVSRRGLIKTNFSPSDIETVGGKISIVNWTTTAVVLASKKPLEILRYQVMISDLCTAIQLNHDLTDAKEDIVKLKNSTLPVSIAANIISPTVDRFENAPTKLLDNVYAQSVVDDVVNIINLYLRKSLEIARFINASPFIRQIEEMIKRNNKMVVSLREIDNIEQRKAYVIETMIKNQGHPDLNYIELE